MRKFLFLLLLCPLPLVTCVNTKGTLRTLNLAEELISSRPDSSLALLNTIHPGQQDSRRTHARYALLRTMALDKNYIDVADDSLAKVAYDYFQRHGGKDYKMKSSYYLGVVEQNATNLIDAAILFKETETQAEKLQDYHFLGLSCQHLSSIFAQNYDHNEALEYALKAEKAFTIADETLSARFSLVDAANQYRALGKFKQAESILDSLLSCPAPHSKGLSNYILVQKAFVYEEENKYAKANESIKLAQTKGYPLSIGSIALLATSEEWLSHSETADSLVSVIQKSILSQIDSIKYLNTIHNILIHRGEYKNAYEAMIAATKLQDKAVITLLDRSITHSFKSYFENSFLLAKEKANSRLMLLLLISLVSILAIVIFILLLQKKNHQIINDLLLIEDVNKDLLSLGNKNKELSNVLNSLIQDKISVMQHLSEAYFQWTDDAVSKREKKEGRLMKEEAISQFRMQIQQLRKDKSITKDIETALNNTYDGIMTRLRLNTSLWENHLSKETDIAILSLLFAGFSVKSISFLMNMTEPSIRTRKTRYKQMFEALDNEDGRLFLTLLS